MPKLVRELALSVLLFGAGASLAFACGPYFPWQLFDDRNGTLKATPKNSFAFEMQHLVPAPKDRLKPVEYDEWSQGNASADFDRGEAAGLSAAQADAIRAMRALSDGDKAYALGANLPPAVRLYTAGAIDFRTDERNAQKRFQAVFALDKKDQWPRAVWAAFMMGRSDMALRDPRFAGAFSLTRALAQGGAPDPLGLAVASYGEEGRVHFYRAIALIRAETRASWTKLSDKEGDTRLADLSLPASSAGEYAQAIGDAVASYAGQAAHGSHIAVDSLRMVAEQVLAEPARIDVTIKNPLVERLLVAYVLARVDDVVRQPASNDQFGAPPPDAGIRDGKVAPNSLLTDLIGAMEGARLDRPAGADRVAALAYRLGRYDLAERAAQWSGSALALWVKAKIALQKGDLATAQRLYAAASRAFSSDLEKDSAVRLIGEGGTLALARGDYVMALDQLYPVAATYWGDVAHIADRVLTVDELKDFVDAKTKAPQAGAQEHCDGWGGEAKPESRLRDLLARRLMREGRFGEAPPYFCSAKTRGDAETYATLLGEGARDWGRVDRAEALFKASVLARESGMEIMGSEAAPDYTDLAGSFDWGVGQSDLKGPFVSKGEHERFAASAAKPDFRFHYRFVAADEAVKAADLLPKRSQAFAAVLCSATGWMLETANGDAPARAKALYHRYVQEGPLVPWAKQFGRKCPDPDFVGAIKRERQEMYRTTRRFASHHRWEIGGAGAAVLVAAMLLLFRRRIAKLLRGRASA